MATNRYENRAIINNRGYSEQRRARRTAVIRHHGTPSMRYPSKVEIARMTVLEHIWKLGDRYYKLANEHYGDPTMWWVLAWFNKAPTESHLEAGRKVYIPFPLEEVLSSLRVY